MKHIILLIVMLALVGITLAQPSSDRLKADLKRLNRRFEKVETIKRLKVDANTQIRLKSVIRSAENELGRFKKKHPNYDVNSFERDLANFKNSKSNVSSGASSGKKGSSAPSSFSKVEDFVETIQLILDFRPDTRKFIQNKPNVLSDTKKQIAIFREKMNRTLTSEFLALSKDQSNRKIKRITDKASREAKSLNRTLSQTNISRIRKETKENLMLSRYFNVFFSLEKLNVLKRVFGGNSDIESAKQIADNLISKLGTVDEIEKQGKANYAAKVAQNRMFPERQNNSGLRNAVIRAFNSGIYRIKGSKVLKARLVSRGWSVTRNKITGIILSRDQQAQIAFKATNGKCYTYLMLFQQKHLGGGKYSRGFNRSGSKSEILCLNIPK